MNAFVLKIIAIISMLIDHTGYIFIDSFPTYYFFRGIGRLAFPIFAFFIAEGCDKTGDIRKYLFRLGLFALIAEMPFDFAFFGSFLDWHYQNIFFTLFLGAAAIHTYNLAILREDKLRHLAYFIPIVFVILAESLHTDYGGIGVLVIFLLFRTKTNRKHQLVVLAVGNVIIALSSHPIQLLGILTIIPLYFYNSERGPSIKYLFYAFYPVHLMILGMIR